MKIKYIFSKWQSRIIRMDRDSFTKSEVKVLLHLILDELNENGYKNQ